MKEVNFLDITLNLTTGVYKPYMKENDHPVYVNTKSNHPPIVLKNIPVGVNTRLNKISSSKDIFDAAKTPYQEALRKSGHSHVLEYSPVQNRGTKKKNRRKSAIWFNPPFSLSVRSSVGKEFLALLDTSFPPSNPLHKLFTRQTLKISYKRMPNMAQAVSGHNAKLLKDDSLVEEMPGCNCRGGPANCPVEGKCLTSCVVYEARVTEQPSGKIETYTGVTGRRFKQRLYEHRTDMRKVKNRTKSALSSHIWNLKDNGVDFEVSWSLKDRSSAYNPTTKKCKICLKEKFYILYKPDGASLNKRGEIFNTCRHRTQRLLDNVKT